MGISFSRPGADALDENFETLFMRSISFSSDTAKSTVRSLSFNGRDSEPAIFKAFGSGKLIIEGSLSFKGREMETKISIKSPTSDKGRSQSFPKSRFSQLNEKIPASPVAQAASPKHEAAVKLQKVYKSFRTRRQLADCAVLVEQRWWKLLDFALLKLSSVSFFDIEKPESAVSRWSRAKARVAKVGKGLSKDKKAQKLALQHWLEAIDPRHRYGHNLHFYYRCWLNCDSKQPFFYWLDVGEGKAVNLEEKCPRWMLQQQCIKYLGPKEREAYEVIVEDGKLCYKHNKKPVDTSEGPEDTKWIFVLSTSKKLYVGQKKKGLFQHSSFLAGGATSSAGRLVVENGILKAVWPHSGHYRPTEENFQEFMSFLKENNVDLTDVKKSPTEDDEEAYSRHRSKTGLASNSSEPDLAASYFSSWHGAQVEMSSHVPDGTNRNIAAAESTITTAANEGVSFGKSPAESKLDGGQTAERTFGLRQCQSKQDMTKDQVESKEETNGKTLCTAETKRINSLERSFGQRYDSSTDPVLGDEEAEDESAPEQPYIFRKRNLFVEEHEEAGGASVPQELILRRINSKKGLESLQLGKQLSFKWTTGAGPRIGCVRDYPSELQFRSLEQVNLSPKPTGPSCSRFYASPRNLTNPCLNTSEATLMEEETQQQQQKPASDR